MTIYGARVASARPEDPTKQGRVRTSSLRWVALLQLFDEYRVDFSVHAAEVSACLALRRRGTGRTVPARTEVVVLHEDVVVVVMTRRTTQAPQVFLDAAGLPFLRWRGTGVPRTPAEVDVVFVSDGRDHERHGVEKVGLTELSEQRAGLCTRRTRGGRLL